MLSPITASLLSNVLSRYPLSDPRIVGALEASKRNDNFLVEDASGDRYVLRRYRRNIEERRVDFQLRFQQHLRRCGFPTSKVVETSLGTPLVICEGAPWALFTYIEGAEYDFGRIKQVIGAARRLAQFHTVTDTFRHQEVIIDTNPRLRRWWTNGEKELQELEAMFAGHGVDDDLSYVRNWWSELLREWTLARLDALPVGWVHGDYHGRNMVFVDDELRGVFDFDVVHRGPMIEDIAHALFTFGRESRGSPHIRAEVARLFLGEYARHKPLEKEERDALPMMTVLEWAPSAPYYALLRRDGEEPALFLQQHASLMRHMRSEMARLGPIFTTE